MVAEVVVLIRRMVSRIVSRIVNRMVNSPIHAIKILKETTGIMDKMDKMEMETTGIMDKMDKMEMETTGIMDKMDQMETTGIMETLRPTMATTMVRVHHPKTAIFSLQCRAETIRLLPCLTLVQEVFSVHSVAAAVAVHHWIVLLDYWAAAVAVYLRWAAVVWEVHHHYLEAVYLHWVVVVLAVQHRC